MSGHLSVLGRLCPCYRTISIACVYGGDIKEVEDNPAWS